MINTPSAYNFLTSWVSLRALPLIFCIYFYPTSVQAFSPAGGSGLSKSTDATIVQKFQSYDGKIIGQFQISGLKRTKEQAARWQMKSLEGSIFNSQTLAQDIQNLYNTGVLYDIEPFVSVSEENSQELRLVISLKDKWTLFPVGGGQGGGGSIIYGGGLYDSNLAGYFINAMVLGYNFNGVFSYDINLNQEYIAGTQTMGSFDWSSNVNPTIIHKKDGSAVGDYIWQRQQEQVMIGTHWAGPIRALVYASLYNDSILVRNGNINVSAYSGAQYRLQPKLIFGRANILNFLEEGGEFSVRPTFANFFGPVNNYESLELSYKNVSVLSHDSNLAFNVSGSLSSAVTSIYQFQVGGYTNVRGYIDNRQLGLYSTFANLEYRPKLFSTDIGLFDLGEAILQGCVFTDAGSAWGDSGLTGEAQNLQASFIWSAGVGIRLNFLHFAGAIMRLDVARTISPDEGSGFSFGVGQFF